MRSFDELHGLVVALKYNTLESSICFTERYFFMVHHNVLTRFTGTQQAPANSKTWSYSL